MRIVFQLYEADVPPHPLLPLRFQNSTSLDLQHPKESKENESFAYKISFFVAINLHSYNCNYST